MVKCKSKLSEIKIEHLLFQFFNWYNYRKFGFRLRVRTFEDAMMLSDDRGILVRCDDEEFVITITRKN